MTAREIAVARLGYWLTSTMRLPAGASPLEPADSATTWWAIRHPRTGALFGWHGDAGRLILLYWNGLAEDERYELIAEAVTALRNEQHYLAWKSAWWHWTSNARVKRGAVDRDAIARNIGDQDALETSMSAFEALADHPEPPDSRLALQLATSALIAGEADLAQHVYVYAAVAAKDRGQIPALLSTIVAVLDQLYDPAT
jgi:hypothetical protein